MKDSCVNFRLQCIDRLREAFLQPTQWKPYSSFCEIESKYGRRTMAMKRSAFPDLASKASSVRNRRGRRPVPAKVLAL